jgi:diphthamide synthase (EF-2-diphthine--ammonia ligase)
MVVLREILSVLLTTVTRDYERVQMHGVRRVSLEQQAESLGLPLRQVSLSPSDKPSERDG